MSLQEFSYQTEPLFLAARAAGIILIGIAGNFGDCCHTHTYPGLFETVISTGATDEFDNLTYFSGLGPPYRLGASTPPLAQGRFKPDVVAPGWNVLSANHDTSKFKYILLSGTSMSAPHVTGLAALLLTRDKTLTQEQVLELIVRNTDRTVDKQFAPWCDRGTIPIDSIPNSLFGYGRINALKAVNAQTAMLTGNK